MKTYLVSISKESLIGQEHSSVDYQDAFGIKLPVEHAIPPEAIVKLFFNSMPGWVNLLLRIRETFAKAIGLKTVNKAEVYKQIDNFTGEPGQSIALFHVKDRSSTEILTGENDKHLDFSLSFIGATHSKEFEIILATTVIFNGWLGKLYFLPVKPIHKILVPAMLKRMSRKLINS